MGGKGVMQVLAVQEVSVLAFQRSSYTVNKVQGSSHMTDLTFISLQAYFVIFFSAFVEQDIDFFHVTLLYDVIRKVLRSNDSYFFKICSCSFV